MSRNTFQYGGVNIYNEILPGDEEDDDVPDLNTDHILWEINDVLNFFNPLVFLQTLRRSLLYLYPQICQM
jgi:hypothetical protein